SRQTDRYKPGGRGHVTCSPRLTDPAPHHVGVEAVIQGNTGNRRAWHQAFGHNTSLQLFGVTATFLIGLGYACVGHVKCPLKNKWTLSWRIRHGAQDGITGRLPLRGRVSGWTWVSARMARAAASVS